MNHLTATSTVTIEHPYSTWLALLLAEGKTDKTNEFVFKRILLPDEIAAMERYLEEENKAA